ncbi:CA216 protein, partial [Rhinopomastus cyanomelas]|nr:CA216 protein [Rhinopomastus cyanomelas]
MFAVCPRSVPANAPFQQGRGGPVPGSAAPARGQDSNSNFVGEVCDSNENWRQQPVPGTPPPGAATANPSPNLLLLKQRQMAPARLRDPGAARLRLPEPGPRSPPEGAEVGGAGGWSTAAEEPSGGCEKPPGSPAEDNGYASSSLGADSPDSACGSGWDPPAADPLPGTPPRAGAAEPGSLLPALAEAVQHLQDKERFKEREKEKHHVQLVMYRRLALLRWIHGLQQRVVDQQNRLQESFDTILDNRKELIRRMQQGAACAAAPGP